MVTGLVPAGLEDTPWHTALHTSSGHAIVLSDSSSETSWLRVISTATLQQVGRCRTLWWAALADAAWRQWPPVAGDATTQLVLLP